MENSDLHPSVREFRAFINRHPKLAASIRKSGRPWQEYYEKWALLGEDDPFWEDFKTETDNPPSAQTQTNSKQTEMFEQLKKISEKVDVDKIQEHAHQLSGTISTIQSLISQFQDNGQHSNASSADRINDTDWFND